MRAVKIWGNSGFVTPLGYSNGHYPRHDQWLLGDDDCTNYHTLPGISFANHLDAKKILEIVRKAVSLFGGERLENFIHTNLLRNQFKSDLHFKFLVDTIDFIKTGVRSMNIQMWMQLLSVPTQSIDKKLQAKSTYTMKPDYYRGASISNWLQHQGGLQDLIITLYIIFGKY